MQETWVQSLGWEDPLEKGRATYSSILAWRIPWTEEHGRGGGIQCMMSERVGHKLAIFSLTVSYLEEKDFNLPDLPWVPKDRLKQLVNRQVWEWRNRGKAVKRQSCSIGQGAGSSLGDVHNNLIYNFCRTWAPTKVENGKLRLSTSMWTPGCLEQEGWWLRFLEHPLFLPNNQKKVTHPTALPLAILPLKTLPWSPSQRLEIFSVSHPFSLLSLRVNLVVAHSCLTVYDPMDCLTQGLPAPPHLPEFSQVHVHWIVDAIQPNHPPLLSSPSAFNLPQHQGLFQWVGSSHQVAKVLELQLQHQSFQRMVRVDFL